MLPIIQHDAFGLAPFGLNGSRPVSHAGNVSGNETYQIVLPVNLLYPVLTLVLIYAAIVAIAMVAPLAYDMAKGYMLVKAAKKEEQPLPIYPPSTKGPI
jgi:hypothetical protein